MALPPQAQRHVQQEHANSSNMTRTEVRPALTNINTNRMSPETLERVFRDQQLEISEVREREQSLRRKIADMENTESGDEDEQPQRKRKKGRKDVADEELEKHRITVNHLAHKYVIMYNFWLHQGKATFTMEADPNYVEVNRFETSESKAQGQRADLLELLPQHLQSDEIMRSGWFADRFRNEMQQQRSNTSTRIRKECGGLIFHCMQDDMVLGKRRVELFNMKNGYKASEEGNGKGTYETWDVEILHSGEHFSGEFDPKTIFLSPFLLRTFAAILYGRTAVTSLVHGDPIVRNGSAVASILGLHYTTPGAIAAAAIVVRWAVSADPELREHGSVTGINYSDLFDEYLEYLKRGLKGKKRSVLNIFRTWDNTFFQATADMGLAATHEKPTKEATQKVMAMLDDEEPESEEEHVDY